MRYLTTEEAEKFTLIDKLFALLSAEDISKVMESELIIEKLKGNTAANIGPITQLFAEFSTLQNEMFNLRNQHNNLTYDFQAMIRCLNKGMGDTYSINEFNNLKSKHSVY